LQDFFLTKYKTIAYVTYSPKRTLDLRATVSMASSTFEAKLVEEFRDLKAQAKQGPVAPPRREQSNL
jgi:hypothetical protein